MQSAPCRKKDSMNPDTTEDEPKEFGDSMTADTMVCGPRDHPVDGDTCAHVIKDRASNWVEGTPAVTKNFRHIKNALQRLCGKSKIKYMYNENSKELRKAMRKMGLPADTSRPYKPQTDGVAERACRHCKEGTICTLEQSGFTAPFWNHAMKCWNVIRNASEVHVKTGKDPYEFRKGENFLY